MTYSYRQYNNCHLKNKPKATINYKFAHYWHQRLTIASKSSQKYTIFEVYHSTELSFGRAS